MRLVFSALAVASLMSLVSTTDANAKFLSADPVQFDDANPDPSYFNRYAYSKNDPINLWDPWGLCSSQAGELVDCPDVVTGSDGVFMQGADFNGLQTNFVSGDNMETLNDVVGIVDEATQTDAGQAWLVGGQEAIGMEVNLITNSGQISSESGSATYTDTGYVIATSFVDTSEFKEVGILGNVTSTGHGLVSGYGSATVAEKVIHELTHATNPGLKEEQTQGISNTIHQDRGSRKIIHGR